MLGKTLGVLKVAMVLLVFVSVVFAVIYFQPIVEAVPYYLQSGTLYFSKLVIPHSSNPSLTSVGQLALNEANNALEYEDDGAVEREVVATNLSQTFTYKTMDATDTTNSLTIKEYKWIDWWEFEPNDTGTARNGWSPFTQMYVSNYDAECATNCGSDQSYKFFTSDRSENIVRLYATAGGNREFKVLIYDDDGTETAMLLLWHVPPDFAGTSMKFRWKGIVTNADPPTLGDDDTIDIQMTGRCFISGDDLDTATSGNTQSAVYQAVGSDAQDDILVSGWATMTTTELPNLGTADYDTCFLVINRDANDVTNDLYDQEFGFLGIEIVYKRTIASGL